jgi:anti-anti-sigma regulatory factor
MEIVNLTEDIIFLELPSNEPDITKQLKALNSTVSEGEPCDVIVGFSNVEIINSSNISNLLILRSFQQDAGRQLILCSVQTVTKCIFVVAGLAESFVFIDDKTAALEAIQSAHQV